MDISSALTARGKIELRHVECARLRMGRGAGMALSKTSAR